jgi:ribonuclease D
VPSVSVAPTFKTPARWVDSPEQLETVIEALLREPQYAIDTEFHREKTYFPHLALVQIGWPGDLVLIDPLALDLRPMERLFKSDVLAVFHAAEQDLEVLQHVVGCTPKNIWDTQVAAGFVGFSTPSLSSLVERILHVSLSKGDRLTDWTQRPLTVAQKTYAALDVEYLLELRRLLLEQLVLAGRDVWVEEEITILRNRHRNNVPEHAWWKLKDGRVLRGRDRIVAQQLCVWRESRARTEDKPVRFVLPDLAVLAVAQSKPTDLDQLASMRGLDGRFLRGGVGKELLVVVAEALALPGNELQQPEPEDFDRKLRPALTLASAWVAQLARDAKIDSGLLATRNDLVQLLRGDRDARLSQGWREPLVGTAVRRLVSGEAAIAFSSTGELTLEQRSGFVLTLDIATPNADWVLESPDHRGDENL